MRVVVTTSVKLNYNRTREVAANRGILMTASRDGMAGDITSIWLILKFSTEFLTMTGY